MMQFGHMTNATPPTTPVDTTATDPSTTSMRRITTDMAPPDAVPPQVPPRSIMTACRRSHHDMAFTSVVSHSVTASATTTVTTNDPLRHTLAHTQESYVITGRRIVYMYWIIDLSLGFHFSNSVSGS